MKLFEYWIQYQLTSKWQFSILPVTSKVNDERRTEFEVDIAETKNPKKTLTPLID